MADTLKRFDILGVKVSAINMEDACSFINEAIIKNKKIYVCVCPVSTIMECYRNKNILKSVNLADLVTPDGMPVVWMGKIKGHNNIRRVYGPDLMLETCKLSQKSGYRNYFYGSTDYCLGKLQNRLKQIFPNLIISGVFSPPFSELFFEEDGRDIEIINQSKSHILWVGLGSPKQDIWMSKFRDKLNVPVIIGVGAAFDFLAGTKIQAPRWIRDSGFEWFFRLITEPKRLWRRYLVDGSLFIYYAARELIFKGF
ncbi:MAG: WecB/TagA/CpsF family glycosyltransferase [Candidatus Omnitrophota bacterium]|nr:WecB/TagA/CpsF family glycosyltransferase [Candidatus Omnitrophota bacterium]